MLLTKGFLADEVKKYKHQMTDKEVRKLIKEFQETDSERVYDLIVKRSILTMLKWTDRSSVPDDYKEDAFQTVFCKKFKYWVYKYDIDGPIKFRGFLRYVFRRELYRFVQDQVPLIRFFKTPQMKKLYFRIPEARDKLIREEKEATPLQISKELNQPLSDIERALEYFNQSVVLHYQQPLAEDPEEDSIQLSNEMSEEDLILVLEKKSIRNEAIKFSKLLGKKDELIFYYTFIAEDSLSEIKLGAELGVSKQRISQRRQTLLRSFKTWHQEGKFNLKFHRAQNIVPSCCTLTI